MTKAILLISWTVVAMFSATSFADGSDSSADESYESNRIDTLHYRVAGGHFLLEADLTSSLHNNETTTYVGGDADGWSRSPTSVGAELIWGITDRWTVSIQESYLINQSDSETNLISGNVRSFHFYGYSDPTVTANYRFLGGLTGDQFGNAYLQVKPAFGTAQMADTNHDGNYLSESSEISAGATFFWVSNHIHEWMLNAAAHYYTSGMDQDEDPLDTESLNSRLTYNIEGAYRIHFLKDFFGQAQLNIQLPSSYKASDSFGGWQVNDAAIVTPDFEFGWRANQNLLLYADLEYENYMVNTTPLVGTIDGSNNVYNVVNVTLGGEVAF